MKKINTKIPVMMFILTVIIIFLMVYYGNKPEGSIVDNDVVDNKGAINPQTIINVNYEDKDRHINEEVIKELNNYLPKSKKDISILFYNNRETYQFAIEIRQYLELEEWKIVNWVMHIPNDIPEQISPNGIAYENQEETFLIEIVD